MDEERDGMSAGGGDTFGQVIGKVRGECEAGMVIGCCCKKQMPTNAVIAMMLEGSVRTETEAASNVVDA